MGRNRNRLGALGDDRSVRVGVLDGGAVNVEPGNMWIAESLTWAALAIVAITAGAALVWVATVVYGAVSGWGG